MPDADAGEPAAVVYDGPTPASGIPSLPEDFAFDASIPPIDSGVIVVDTRCCETTFSIADEEPAGGVEGVLRLGLNVFDGGVPLSRDVDAGRWVASACVPVNSEATFVYEFTIDGGLSDAGLVELEDGGLLGREAVDVRVTVRTSAEEPSAELVDGARVNVYRAVSTCDGLDGSVPR
jgi:hypothetical protein